MIKSLLTVDPEGENCLRWPLGQATKGYRLIYLISWKDSSFHYSLLPQFRLVLFWLGGRKVKQYFWIFFSSKKTRNLYHTADIGRLSTADRFWSVAELNSHRSLHYLTQFIVGIWHESNPFQQWNSLIERFISSRKIGMLWFINCCFWKFFQGLVRVKMIQDRPNSIVF